MSMVEREGHSTEAEVLKPSFRASGVVRVRI